VVANPIPEADALPQAEVDNAIETALKAAHDGGLRGAAVTPFVLARLAEVTQGRSIPANLALAEHNAVVAARIAVAFGSL
jgi:pseudouridylate synthase